MNYETFKIQVLDLTGINLSAYKENQMKRRIDAIVKKNQCNNYSEYIILLKSNASSLQEFVTYLTINVTEFFRNPSQWDILEKQIFPLLLQKKRQIKIWSAACSTGDEPYSLAMVLSKFMPLNQINIIATDLDKEVLEKARAGQYIGRSIANVPKEFQEKYFTENKGIYSIRPNLKECITFKQHNLLKDPYPSSIDLIVCRNVLIYFTEEAKKQIYTNFNRALADDGILFVGSTEQIIMCQDYGFESYKIFFYQKAGLKR
ncbi:CheR family methyltransferase [Cellulosilyticum sp. I15G10I2]|uniref:CheR family methyltransferase n=1 Tax=Cellulosilyticum sp. I15G10I2 TaxID=1892843 RepID=UPI00085BBD15|nr:protein-glutamate O-methyltransferase CheR [Cellulosilyticum sp. I15G10I2]